MSAEIRRAIELIAGPAWERGDVVELRALKTTKGTVSGYFDADHIDEFVKEADKWSGVGQGVYITLNPIMPACLARSANHCKPYVHGTTGDKEITHRNWFLVDFDPERPSGISATDAEKQLALDKALQAREWLTEQGWPLPIYADSGNGAHLLYRVDLPVDDGNLLKSVLKALSDKFGDETVGVDLKVHNPARISKLYGTLSCKGDDMEDRPYRVAEILEVPDAIEVVSRELLEATRPTTTKPTGSFDPNAQHFNVVAYLDAHGIGVGKEKDFGDGRLWELDHCPWRPNEDDGGPFVVQHVDGRITAKCHHNKCEGKGWEDLRDKVEPGWRDTNSNKKPTIAEQVVALAKDDELFHTSENDAYATVQVNRHRETYKLNGDGYKLQLRRRLHESGVVANKNAVDDAIATLEGKALFDGEQREVFVRTAEHNGKVYVDLCNENWEVIEIDAGGWRLARDSPVRFVRRDGMLPLPIPTEGGTIEQLREFINVTDADWPLVVAWLLAAVRPTGPYPILLVNGEKGSCKSTTCRRLRALVDPNKADLRNKPKDEHALMIWAQNSHIIALDNLSDFPQWLSDAMCRLATGGAGSHRALYSNDSEKLFSAQRPQIVNGIGDFATRSDFLDRCLTVSLPVIKERKTIQELDQAFDKVYPSLLGAIFSTLSRALAAIPEVEKLELDLPRMADFAKWAIAVELGLEWKAGTMQQAMDACRGEAHELAIAASPVADAVRRFIWERRKWHGGWTDLLDELNAYAEREEISRRDGWPPNGNKLSTQLREAAPDLRSVGIKVEFHDKKRPKELTLELEFAPAEPQTACYGNGSGTAEDKYVPAQILCYGNESDAERLIQRLLRVWMAPPTVAPVATPSLDVWSGDGTEMAEI